MVRKAALILGLASVATIGAAPINTSTFEAVTFQIEQNKDPINDDVSMLASAGDRNHYVAVGCASKNAGKVMVMLKFPGFLGYDYPGIVAGGTTIEYRFDDLPAREVRWYSRDESAFTGPQAKPDQFVVELENATRVYIRATPRGGRMTELGFKFAPPASEIAQVMDYCGASVKAHS